MHMVRLARDVGPAAREQELRDFLGQFRFTGDMVHQAVGTLSGGEKARLVLAMLVWQRPNLLLLDEPTNHLDLTTREALSIALNEFEGTVMLVSHDRALLREVCDEFWLVSARRRAALRRRPRRLPALAARGLARHGARPAAAAAAAADAAAERAAPPRPPRRGRQRAAATPPHRAGPAAATTARPASRRARARPSRPGRCASSCSSIDGRLARLAAEKAEVEALLADAATPAADYAELGRRLAHIGAEVAMLEERWLALQTELGRADQPG